MVIDYRLSKFKTRIGIAYLRTPGGQAIIEIKRNDRLSAAQ